MAVSLLHQPWVVADGDAPVLELASMTVDRAQFHHHLIRVEIKHDVYMVFDDQRQHVVLSRETERVAVEVGEVLVHVPGRVGAEAFLAYLAVPGEALTVGTPVVVVEYQPPRTVYVAPALG